MNTKKSSDTAAVAAYRAGAEQRRARTRARGMLVVASEDLESSVTNGEEIVTLRLPADAKPVRSLGGPTKAFGTSRFSIPEFKRYKK